MKLKRDQGEAVAAALGELNKLRLELDLPASATATEIRMAVVSALRSRVAPRPYTESEARELALNGTTVEDVR